MDAVMAATGSRRGSAQPCPIRPPAPPCAPSPCRQQQHASAQLTCSRLLIMGRPERRPLLPSPLAAVTFGSAPSVGAAPCAAPANRASPKVPLKMKPGLNSSMVVVESRPYWRSTTHSCRWGGHLRSDASAFLQRALPCLAPAVAALLQHCASQHCSGALLACVLAAAAVTKADV